MKRKQSMRHGKGALRSRIRLSWWQLYSWICGCIQDQCRMLPIHATQTMINSNNCKWQVMSCIVIVHAYLDWCPWICSVKHFPHAFMFLHYFVKLVGSGICTLFTYVNGGMGNYSLNAGEMNWHISEQFDLFCSFLLYTPTDCYKSVHRYTWLMQCIPSDMRTVYTLLSFTVIRLWRPVHPFCTKLV